MKKFIFGKKSDDGKESNGTALFGTWKKTSTTPQPDNPYVNQAVNDSYVNQAKYANITPYQPTHNGQGGGPPQALPIQSSGTLVSPLSGPNENNTGAFPSFAYGADHCGSRSGYSGGYSSETHNASSTRPRKPGGYGGLGQATDALDGNRDVLFSGALDRHRQMQQSANSTAGSSFTQPDATVSSYGGYGEQRELSAEEQEEVDYQAILAEKRQLQQESATSVSRSVQMARQANEVGRATLARLGAQGERLHNTEKHLDLAANQNKIAQDRAAELKTLNGSMFAIHVGNPFTSKQRQARMDEEIMTRHRAEREQREATHREGYTSSQRMDSNLRQIGSTGTSRQQSQKKNYGKFNLEDEEGADELEDQIDEGLSELEGQVKMMNMVGRAIGQEVDVQNNQIGRIMNKSDAVDDATRMNRERLSRIK